MSKLNARPEDFVSAKDITNALGISEATLRRHLDANRFPQPANLPGRRRWFRADVEAFLAQARTAA